MRKSKPLRMYIKRKLEETVVKRLFRHKAIIILGARQVGKSTLMARVTENLDLPVLNLNCDDPDVRNILTDINSANLRLLLGQNKIVTRVRDNNVGNHLHSDRHRLLGGQVMGAADSTCKCKIRQ